MDSPKVSVLMTVFNGGSYLESAVQSILHQTWKNFELIVIDDGSQDGSSELLDRLAQTDSRLKVFHQANQGIGLASQKGFSLCCGDYVARADADDESCPDRLSLQVEFLNQHLDYVLVGGALQIVDSSNRVVGHRIYPEDDFQIRSRMMLFNPIPQPAVMFRRQAAVAVGGYTDEFGSCNDYDLWVRLSARGKMYNFRQTLTRYRIHPQASKSTETLRQISHTRAIRRRGLESQLFSNSWKIRLVDWVQALLEKTPPSLVRFLFRQIFYRSTR